MDIKINMSSVKKKLLRQLSIKELHSLAKSKGHKIPSSFKKKELVDYLSLNVTKKDIETFVKPSSRAKTKEGKGYEAREKGTKLEDKVLKSFTRQGYTCEKNVRVPGAEFDVIGSKEGRWFSRDQWIFVECKNKAKVIPVDFKKFIGNMSLFQKRRSINDEDIIGYLCYTGIVDPQVKSQVRKFSNVKLKRFKL